MVEGSLQDGVIQGQVNWQSLRDDDGMEGILWLPALRGGIMRGCGGARKMERTVFELLRGAARIDLSANSEAFPQALRAGGTLTAAGMGSLQEVNRTMFATAGGMCTD
jgi:hypothetical protein